MAVGLSKAASNWRVRCGYAMFQGPKVRSVEDSIEGCSPKGWQKESGHQRVHRALPEGPRSPLAARTGPCRGGRAGATCLGGAKDPKVDPLAVAGPELLGCHVDVAVLAVPHEHGASTGADDDAAANAVIHLGGERGEERIASSDALSPPSSLQG